MITNKVKLFDYRNAEAFSYNSQYVEITEFGAKLKSQLDENVIYGATWHESTNGSYAISNFELNPILQGNILVDNRRLNMTGGAFKKKATLEISTPLEKWGYTFRFYYFPNYSGVPNKLQEIFSLREVVGKNEIKLVHSTSGDFVFSVADKNEIADSATLQKAIEIANDPIEIIFQVIYQEADDTVDILCYIDTELVADFLLDAADLEMAKFRNVVFGGTASYTNFGISDFLVLRDVPNIQYNEEEDEGRYIIEDEMPEHQYTLNPQRIKPKDYLTLDKLTYIKELATYDDTSFLVRYTFELDDHEWFFDRTSLQWKPRLEETDYTDLTYLLKYKDQVIKQGVKFKLIPYLISVGGDTTPTLTTNVVNYDEYIDGRKEFPVATVYGYVRDCFGQPIRNAKVRITPNKASVSSQGNYIMAKMTKQVRTGQQGYWDMQLPLTNSLDEEFTYNIEVIVKEQVVYKAANISVTEEGTISIEDLIEGNVHPQPQPTPEGLIPIPNSQGLYYVEIDEDEEESEDNG